jgi:hypothetical protein
VISKFELAGALAEQMAELGDPGTETRAETAQAGATVHQLHTRDDAEPAAPTANVIDLVPPTEWGAGSVLSNGAPVAEEHVAEEPVAEQKSEFDAISSHTEPVEEARPAEEMLTELHEALAAEERVAADEPVAAELSTEQEALETVEPHAEGEPVETVDAHVGPVEEPWPAEVMSTEPDAVVDEEPVAAELSAEREALETVEAYAEPVEEPWAAEVMQTEAHDTPAVEVGYVDEAAHDGDPLPACVAFAPTTEGYRLVALEAQPAAGETIDIPDVGEYLVLRVGSSPIPGDERRCAYVEERMTPALIAAVAH